MEIVVFLIAVAALTFCVTQFVDLMRRSDSEFPGKFDKPIWAATILLTNVVGAFIFFACKPLTVPRSNRSLEADLAAALKAKAGDGSASAG